MSDELKQVEPETTQEPQDNSSNTVDVESLVKQAVEEALSKSKNEIAGLNKKVSSLSDEKKRLQMEKLTEVEKAQLVAKETTELYLNKLISTEAKRLELNEENLVLLKSQTPDEIDIRVRAIDSLVNPFKEKIKDLEAKLKDKSLSTGNLGGKGGIPEAKPTVTGEVQALRQAGESSKATRLAIGSAIENAIKGRS